VIAGWTYGGAPIVVVSYSRFLFTFLKYYNPLRRAASMGSRGTGSGGGPASVCGTLDVRVSLEHVCLADQVARCSTTMNRKQMTCSGWLSP